MNILCVERERGLLDFFRTFQTHIWKNHLKRPGRGDGELPSRGALTLIILIYIRNFPISRAADYFI